MDQKYFDQIARQFNISRSQVDRISQMHSEGATIPFMSRYRKEVTGNLDEVVIGGVVEALGYYKELQKRKETVIQTIEESGKLTPELKARIETCFDATALEDIYLPFKPKRKTRASQAVEKGLEPLAQEIWKQTDMDPDQFAENFINDQVKDSKEALQGARDIMAEWISEHELARAKVRQLFAASATVRSKLLSTKKDEPEAQKFRDYFDFSELLSKCPSHRLLAIRRGEKEGFLSMDISIEKTIAVESLEALIIKSHNHSAAEITKSIEDSYNRLLKSSIENEFRLLSKQKADEDAIHVFSENLRQLLLASPLGNKNVLALDPGFRSGCKLVCLDAQGNLVHNTTIFPHPPQNQWQESTALMKQLVSKFNIEAVGVGNGTAGRETEQMVRSIDFGKPLRIFQVNESGASIYSASDVAREEFPDHDVTVRGAISIGRRLLDPLSELVKIDPKSIGVGQYQHDVNQLKLKQALDRVVESAVNFVGVDLNTASRHLLQYVSGISATLAQNIVSHRLQQGPFKSREDLKKVPMMGPKSFEQCAGFLRIPNAFHPLDNSSVHPESYPIVESMAKDLQASLEELILKADLRKQVDKSKYLNEKAGTFTIEDILKELEKPGRDPRAQIEEFRFDDTVKSIEDLRQGMVLPGIVTNITNFGAFVDIGVKQDGLVHVSQMANRYIADPNEVVKLNQKVKVMVSEVDVARKRIQLSMKDEAAQVQKEIKPEAAKKPVVKAEKETDAFHLKLQELKKKLGKN
ncbi:MAG: RNA-binding transcriptional accessory protein [Flavisolibacter sp.]|jgi:uncharacterized protein|nr:RNA-binding transcriptional accessory protein [Flavisolibacter sp.]